MNIYTLVILLALLVNFVLELVSEFLNLKALSPELPAEFRGTYDEKEYARSQQYTREKTGYGIIVGICDITVLLLFWFLGGFNTLDLWVRDFGFGEIVTGLVFMGILILLKTIFSLPFRIYSTFVIEEKYGFNRTTPGVFAADLAKGLVLTVVLGGPLLAAILALFEYAGTIAWLYCWLVTTAFILIVQFIAPTWIMPLFNKFTPLEEGELREAILDYARSVSFPLENVYVMDGSKRSSKSNAFFTGFGKHKRIALFDTLIEKHTTDELLAILAHEIGHFKKKHILQGMIISIAHTGFMLWMLSIFISHGGLFDAFYMQYSSVYAGMIFFGMLFTPLELALSIIMNIVSRKNEYEADRFAVATTDKPEKMIAALKKLSVHNLANLTPHPFTVFLHYSHPPLLERISAIRRVA